MTRIVRTSRPTLAFTVMFGTLAAIGVSMGSLSPNAHAGDDDAANKPCTTTKFSQPSVEKACKEGGRKAAQKLMKDLVKKAKAAGKDVKCLDCHKDVKNFELKPNAVTDLEPLI